ncbi:MAG TPA: hypothetical protein VE692_06400 [Nitrososphaera sp.]|nr:hypothetical protein [Nitrososphaera sp.]
MEARVGRVPITFAKLNKMGGWMKERYAKGTTVHGKYTITSCFL